MVLTIGDIDLCVHSEPVLSDHGDPSYAPFLVPRVVGGARPSEIDVEILAERVPSLESSPLFESGGAWNMQPEGPGYRLNFHRGDTSLFHTVACSDADTTQVRVYVDQDRPASQAGVHRPADPVHYPLDQLLVMNHLATRGGFVVHAAAAVVDGGALVFPGASGAGKSTLSRLFIDAGWGDALLSDDRVVMQLVSAGNGRRTPDDRQGPDLVEVWGTPWPGDARVAKNAFAPLAAVLFLVKADETELVPLSVGAAMRRLMPVVSCPWYDPARLPGVLDTCARIVESVPGYDLHFRPGDEVVALLTGRSWARGGA